MRGDHKRLCGNHDQPEVLRSNSIPPYTNGCPHRDLIPGECGQVSAFQTTGAYVIKTLRMLTCFCHLGMFLSPANTTSRNHLCCALFVFPFPPLPSTITSSVGHCRPRFHLVGLMGSANRNSSSANLGSFTLVSGWH